MLLTIPTPQVVNTPITYVQNYIDSSHAHNITKRGAVIENKLLETLLSIIKGMLVQVHEEILSFSKDEAISIWDEIEPSMGIRAVLDKELKGIGMPSRSEDKKVYTLLMNVWDSASELVDDIRMIAEGRIVNESSVDYKKFITKITEEGQNTQRVVGEKALLDLFK